MDNEKVYYIIREDVLPEAVKKTIIMKKALEENPKLKPIYNKIQEANNKAKGGQQ